MIVYVSLVAPSVVYRQFSQPGGSKKCLLENYYLFLVLSFYLQKKRWTLCPGCDGIYQKCPQVEEIINLVCCLILGMIRNVFLRSIVVPRSPWPYECQSLRFLKVLSQSLSGLAAMMWLPSPLNSLSA